MRPSPACALALILTLAACSHTSTDTTAAPASLTAAGYGARHSWTKPGVLRFTELGEPDSLSPLVGNSQLDVDLSMFWGGYLFNYDDHHRLLPELATVEPTLANGGIAKDGKTITYHLRRGVMWQDGAPFSADDVIFSWHAVMNPNTNVQNRSGYDVISSIDEPDRYTAVVHLKAPFAPFVNEFFSMSSTPFPVYPKHLLAQYHDLNRVAYNSKPVGTGPFIVQEWHRGDTLRMIANPHYWRGAPKLKEVDFRSIPDENTIETSLRTHEIDLWYIASATNYPTASKIAGTHAVLTPFTQYSMVGFNTQRPVMRDLAVRHALAYATDRKRLIDTVTFGVNLLGEGDQPAFSWAHDPNLHPIPYDPAKARAVLEAAGWKAGPDGVRVKNGQRLHIEFATTTGSAVGNRLAVLLQSAWHDIGVETDVRPYVASLMFATLQSGGIVQGGKYDVQTSSWINGVDPDDSTNFSCNAFPPDGQNTFRFCSKELDAQEQIALTSFDRTVRKRAYARIQTILVDQVPFVTAWFARRLDVVSDDLRGYKPASAFTAFWNTWEYDI